VREIGDYLVKSLPAHDDEGDPIFQVRQFPYPGWSSVEYERGLPSIIARWDGIAFDSPQEHSRVMVPNGLRFELRILHPSLDAPEEFAADPYTFAQNAVLEGTGHFITALIEDRTLGGRIVDCGVESSIVGDTFDPTTEQPFYAHQLTLVTSLTI